MILMNAPAVCSVTYVEDIDLERADLRGARIDASTELSRPNVEGENATLFSVDVSSSKAVPVR